MRIFQQDTTTSLFFKTKSIIKVNIMNNKTTALLATTLLTALLASQSVIAGQAPRDEYSAPIVYASEVADERVNFSIEINPVDEELDAELFPEFEH